jgi:hypothetical protein
MDAKFTPGPWIVDPEDHRLVTTQDGSVISAAFGRGSESLANGRLNAAAPELYEALDALVNEPTGAPDYLPSRLWDAARAALRKARGEA